MKIDYIIEEDYNLDLLDKQILKEKFILKYYNYIKKRENIIS